MTLKDAIKTLMRFAKVSTMGDGARVHEFHGNVAPELRECVWDAFHAGVLDCEMLGGKSCLTAERDGCVVAFSFGVGASTTNYCWFSFIDTRRTFAAV